ncbi:MAG: tetratricopeptide repeat protein [Chloroflexi bacterium]|nr:tetratricopeptide repeat protein [Chloroflexota bacterium]
MASQPGEAVQPGATARASLLRMASAWQHAGQLNQAIGAYTRLLARYPGSAEAREAADHLLALAQAHERAGRYHLALGLYEKLERLL